MTRDSARIQVHRSGTSPITLGWFLWFSCASASGQCQIAKLLAPDAGTVDLMGNRVAMSPDAAFAGAWRHDHFYEGSGGLYVFQSGDAGCCDVDELTFFPGEGISFGNAISVQGALGVVGARGYWPSLIERRYGAWIRGQYLRPPGPFPHGLGASVALHGARAVIGAPDDVNENGGPAGSAFVFEPDGAGSWTQSAKLRPGPVNRGDAFGTAVALHNDLIVVGAPLGFSAGSAHVFELDDAGEWIETAELLPSVTGFLDRFGVGVATDATTILVGAQNASDGPAAPGGVFVFERDEKGAWSEIQKLAPPDGQNGDFFGISVAMADDMAIVGAENYGETFFGYGAAFAYQRTPDRQWKLAGLITAADPEDNCEFGRSVALSGNLAAVGAPYKDGVDAANHPIADAGAAYVFAVGPDRDDDGLMDVCECRTVADELASAAGGGYVGNPDLDLDGLIDLPDVILLLTHYGATRDNPPPGLNAPFGALHEYGDLDLNQRIDLQDLALMLTAFGRSCE